MTLYIHESFLFGMDEVFHAPSTQTSHHVLVPPWPSYRWFGVDTSKVGEFNGRTGVNHCATVCGALNTAANQPA